MLTTTYPEKTVDPRRAAQLAQLAAGVDITTPDPAADLVDPIPAVAMHQTVALTGVHVDAGGDVARVFIRRATLTWRDAERRQAFAFPNLGDVVHVTEAEARRGESLGYLAPAEEFAETGAVDVARVDAVAGIVEQQFTDSELSSMRVSQLLLMVATAGPESLARVRNLEELRKDGGRPSVLQALAAAELPVTD